MPPRTVLHGIDQSVPTYRDLPNKGHSATLVLQESHKCTWLYDPDLNVWKPFEYVAFEYDFAEDGGGVGFHNLDVELPAHTLIFDGMIDVVDTFISGGGATISIKVEAADDVLAAGNLAANGVVGLLDIVPDGTVANAIRTTIAQQIKMDIRVADLTAGKLYGFLRCFRSWQLEEQSSSSSNSSSSSSSLSSSSSSSASVSSSSPSSSSSSSTQESTSTAQTSSSSSTAQTSSSSSTEQTSSSSSTLAVTSSSSSSASSASSSSASGSSASSSSSSAQTTF